MRDISRPVPDWVITEFYEDRELGALKSGKEAEVFLVERRSGDRSCLLAHKRYPPRSPRKGELLELGFSRGRTFRHKEAYREGRRIAISRDRRAVEKRTRYGKTLMDGMWRGNEFEALEKAWQHGARVPYPVEMSADGILMEYIGGLDGAAPGLFETRPSPGEARDLFEHLFEQTIDNVRCLLRSSLVHADLSPYNILVWEGCAYFIDFPQTVHIAANPSGLDFLHRDLENVCHFFARKGVACSPSALFAELLSEIT